MRSRPVSSVTAERTCSINAGLFASTVTPGNTAPEVSVTTPVSAAPAWARATVGTKTRQMVRIKSICARMTVLLKFVGKAFGRWRDYTSKRIAGQIKAVDGRGHKAHGYVHAITFRHARSRGLYARVPFSALARVSHFAHQRQKIPVGIAKECHPEVMIRRFCEQVRFVVELDST